MPMDAGRASKGIHDLRSTSPPNRDSAGLSVLFTTPSATSPDPNSSSPLTVQGCANNAGSITPDAAGSTASSSCASVTSCLDVAITIPRLAVSDHSHLDGIRVKPETAARLMELAALGHLCSSSVHLDIVSRRRHGHADAPNPESLGACERSGSRGSERISSAVSSRSCLSPTARTFGFSAGKLGLSASRSPYAYSQDGAVSSKADAIAYTDIVDPEAIEQEVVLSPESLRKLTSSLVLQRDHSCAAEKFHENLLMLRMSKTGCDFDPRHAAVLICCYNEQEKTHFTVDSLVAEVPVLWDRQPQIQKLTCLFIVDGSGAEQLATASQILRCFQEHLQGKRQSFQCPPGDLSHRSRRKAEQFAEWASLFEKLSRDLEEIDKVKAFVENTSELWARGKYCTTKDSLEDLVRASEERKSRLFADTSVHAQYRDYLSQLCEVSITIPIERSNGDARGHGDIFHLDFVLLVKECNRQKRDSVLLGLHKLLMVPDTAELTAFLDADTSFTRGSLSRLFERMSSDTEVAGCSGFLRVRNSSFLMPLTNIQDHAWLISQVMAKSAEDALAAVTCLPGAFSAVRTASFTEPSVLEQAAAAPASLVHKNMVDLGEDRFMTTLLIAAGTRCHPFKTVFVKEAVASSDAPSDCTTFILQQRRWINSTVCNFFFGLLPHSFRALYARASSGELGVRLATVYVFLILRSILETVFYFLSPSLFCIFAFSILQSIEYSDPMVCVWFAMLLFAVSAFITVVFSKPQNFRWLYSVLFVLSSFASLGLFSVWTYSCFYQWFMQTRHFRDEPWERARVLLVSFIWLAPLILATLHGKILQFFNPVWKVLLHTSLSYIHYVFLPCFSVYHLNDFSWGNKQTERKARARDATRADQATKYSFIAFLCTNFVLIYYVAVNLWEPISASRFQVILLTVISSAMWIFFFMSGYSALRDLVSRLLRCKWDYCFLPLRFVRQERHAATSSVDPLERSKAAGDDSALQKDHLQRLSLEIKCRDAAGSSVSA